MAAPRRQSAPSGSTSGADLVRIDGLKELRKALRAAEDPKAWGKELGRANRDGARQVAAWAQATAQAMGGPFAHFAPQISGRATQTAARIQIDSTANATFWGAKGRSGWNYGNDGAPQHPEWVGSSWDVGVVGQGPYAINDTIARRSVEIDVIYRAVIDRIAGEAFPD